MPLLGDERDPKLERPSRRRVRHLPARHENAAAARPPHAEDRLEQLCPSGSDEAGESDDLAGANLEGDALARPGDEQVIDLEERLPRLDLTLVVVARELAADHGRRETLLGQLLARNLADVASVAQDDRAVRKLDRLGQSVRDEDDRRAAVAETP